MRTHVINICIFIIIQVFTTQLLEDRNLNISMDNGAWPVTPGLGRKPEDQEFDSSKCTVSWRLAWVVPDPVSENKQTKK